MTATWNVFQSAFTTHLRLTLARPTFQITLIVQPIVFATISYMIYQRSTSRTDFFSFVVLGSGIAGLWSSIVFSSAGDINRERAYGTLSSLFNTPSSLTNVMLAKIAANALLSTLSLVVSFIFSLIFLHIPIRILHPFAFALAFVSLLISTSLFALALSSIFLLSRATTVMQNFLEYPIFIVSGIFFPLSFLPGWIHPLSWPVPLTWGAETMRLTLRVRWDTVAFWNTLGLEGTLMVFYALVVLVLFRFIAHRVRVVANLDMY